MDAKYLVLLIAKGPDGVYSEKSYLGIGDEINIDDGVLGYDDIENVSPMTKEEAEELLAFTQKELEDKGESEVKAKIIDTEGNVVDNSQTLTESKMKEGVFDKIFNKDPIYSQTAYDKTLAKGKSRQEEIQNQQKLREGFRQLVRESETVADLSRKVLEYYPEASFAFSINVKENVIESVVDRDHYALKTAFRIWHSEEGRALEKYINKYTKKSWRLWVNTTANEDDSVIIYFLDELDDWMKLKNLFLNGAVAGTSIEGSSKIPEIFEGQFEVSWDGGFSSKIANLASKELKEGKVREEDKDYTKLCESLIEYDEDDDDLLGYDEGIAPGIPADDEEFMNGVGQDSTDFPAFWEDDSDAYDYYTDDEMAAEGFEKTGVNTADKDKDWQPDVAFDKFKKPGSSRRVNRKWNWRNSDESDKEIASEVDAEADAGAFVGNEHADHWEDDPSSAELKKHPNMTSVAPFLHMEDDFDDYELSSDNNLVGVSHSGAIDDPNASVGYAEEVDYDPFAESQKLAKRRLFNDIFGACN